MRLGFATTQSGELTPAAGRLVGLTDRLEALGGTLHFTSPDDNGPTLLITIQLNDHGIPGWSGP